jgi:drug/metabolite transporter superfamily protein YnfA
VRLFSIGAVMALNLFILVRYVGLIRRSRIQPALAMWVFFTVAVAGSLITYLSEGAHGPLDNILNTSDMVLVVSVTVAIFLFGDKTSRFTRFDLGCLVAVLGILVFWAFTREHAAAHLAIQAILVIAYFPVVRRIWKTNTNTEPFAPWIGMLLAAALALLSSNGVLATVYAARAVACTSLLLLLMIRAKRRESRGRAGLYEVPRGPTTPAS